MTIKNTVWVVDDERSIRWVLDKAITQAGHQVTCFESAEELLANLAIEQPDAIISDIKMPGMDGLAMLEQIQAERADIPVIIMTAHSDLDSAVSSIQGGAFEYIPKPFEVDNVVEVVSKAISHAHDLKNTTPETDNTFSSEIIGKAPAMQEVFRAIGRLSKSSVTVLINGQSGTGKELVAHALHKHSPRANKPFVALNMAAIPKDLIESELFGHEKGAFTGANQSRIGRFEQASEGTLFLDEIGDMPAETQTRLLRVLSDGKFYRVGGHNPMTSKVRIIAATHQNLEALVEQNLFREDLYHRLNVIRVHIPTLKERREDIPLLCHFFLQLAAKELDEEPKRLLPETIEFITNLDWPGNVRQLENFCRWITVMATSNDIMVSDLPSELLEENAANDGVDSSDETWEKTLASWASQQLNLLKPGDPGLLAEAMPKFEKIMIEAALNQTGGRKNDASILLGWGRNTLTRKMSELKMS